MARRKKELTFDECCDVVKDIDEKLKTKKEDLETLKQKVAKARAEYTELELERANKWNEAILAYMKENENKSDMPYYESFSLAVEKAMKKKDDAETQAAE